MSHFSFFRAALVATLLAVIGTPSTRAQTVLADLAGNYASSGTLTDTLGTGTWNYYASSAATGGVLTALTYGPVGGDSAMGYGIPDSGYSLPAVSSTTLFSDGALPASNQLAWHPGADSTEFIVLRWTAGAGAAGPIRLEASVSKMGEPDGVVDFFIFVNGVQSITQIGITQGTFFAYDFTTDILEGQTVDFVLGSSNGTYAADETLVSGTISSAIPEPSTYAVLAGLAALGLVALRKRTKH
ncbi:PEP-CTERM sorting domain-containing protein [Oleiharenicola lentus]|uniref:PEP-CTERM sorting domain-containing protein n=1 Tax=Oleiharenicola lentus TaxID=2508720 RepID=UPI003F663D54